MRTLITLAVIGLLTGCTYQSQVTPQASYDVYSGYEDRVSGKWALHVSGENNLQGTAEELSYTCSAHNYPISYGSSFRNSVEATISNLVDDIESTSDVPVESLDSATAGLIRVRAESADADLRFHQGFWTSKPEANARVRATLQVEGKSGKLMGTTVIGRGTAGAEGGCEKGADALRKASEEALEELMREIGERFTNSPRVRSYSRGESIYPVTY